MFLVAEIMKRYRYTISLLVLTGMVNLAGCSNSNVPLDRIPESTTASRIEETSILESTTSEIIGTETAGTETLPSKIVKSETVLQEIPESEYSTSEIEVSVLETTGSDRDLDKDESTSLEENSETTTVTEKETKIEKETESTAAEAETTTIEAETTLPAETTTAAVVLQGYLFQANGLSIGMHEDAEGVLAALGAADAYFETPSCAFLGVDRQYTYGNYMLTTYEENGREYIYDIYFLDETVCTPEGIRIGSGIEEMIAAYGDGYTEDFGMYTYTKEQSKLQFLIADGIVTSIDYTALTN